MEDITFDTYGVSIKQQEMTLIDKYRDKLREKFKSLVQSLDVYQREIVFDRNIELPLKITANSGSGKTHCLLAKALKMVIEDKIYPGSIVLITFTNKAANEIKERYINFFRGVLSEGEITEISLPHMSTIHSFACFILYKLFGIRRTILTEYHALKLLKSIVLKVLKLPKIEQVKVKAIYALIQKIYANNEVHFFCIPQFNPDSTFHKILPGRDSNLFDCFSRTGITARLKGRVELGMAERDEVKRGYASEIGITIDQLTEILILFLERKYISNTMDFSDMRFLPFCILNQYKSKLQEVWEDYKYFIIDEAQDINCMDFSLAVTCDKDSYKRFLG